MHDPLSTLPELGALRSVPYMGVIFVVAEAVKLCFENGHPDWCNLGQGQPEVGEMRGAPPRILDVHIDPSDCAYGPLEGIPELRQEIEERDLAGYVFSNPSNPTGNVVRGDELRAFVDLARAERTTLSSDEFYSHFTYEPGPNGEYTPAAGPVSAAEFVEDCDEDPVLKFDGLTKSHRYPGKRRRGTSRYRQWMRFSFGPPMDNVQMGLDRLERMLKG